MSIQMCSHPHPFVRISSRDNVCISLLLQKTGVSNQRCKIQDMAEDCLFCTPLLSSADPRVDTPQNSVRLSSSASTW